MANHNKELPHKKKGWYLKLNITALGTCNQKEEDQKMSSFKNKVYIQGTQGPMGMSDASFEGLVLGFNFLGPSTKAAI